MILGKERKRKPTHPGRILRNYFMKPRKINVTALARAVGISRKHTSNIVNEHVSITANIAVRLGVLFDTTPEFWMKLQSNLSLFNAQQRLSGRF